MGGERRRDLLGGDFVLRDPNPFLKIDQIVICPVITWLSHVNSFCQIGRGFRRRPNLPHVLQPLLAQRIHFGTEK